MEKVRSAHTVLPDKIKRSLVTPCVDGRIRLKWILEIIGYEGGDWFKLAQDCVQFQYFVNMAMELHYHLSNYKLFKKTLIMELITWLVS
jgi:hypothetical protein